MTLSDAEVARRYGIAKSTYSVKPAHEKASIRRFVEAGGNKRTQDAVAYLMKKAYQVNAINRSRVTVDIKLVSFEVIVGCHTLHVGELCSQSLMDAAFKLNQLLAD